MLVFVVLARFVVPAYAAELSVDAPPSLEAAAEQIQSADLGRLEIELRRAGLELPDRIRVVLVPSDDPDVRELPAWVVGLALGEEDIVIFPQRVLPYPYDSLESVLRHEITHLALNRRAGGASLPRWFHEGVAMAVDGDWGMAGQLRLLFEMARDPGTDELGRLFESANRPDSALAYTMSAALVADLQERHGTDIPGRIAARVARGEQFERAFRLETGETADLAASRAWGIYRRWTNWVPALTSGSALWTVIMIVAAAAFVAVRRRRAQRRRRWDEEEDAYTSPDGE